MDSDAFKIYIRSLPIIFLAALMLNQEINKNVTTNNEVATESEIHKIKKVKEITDLDKMVENKEVVNLLSFLPSNSREFLILDDALKSMSLSVEGFCYNYYNYSDSDKIKALKKLGLAAIVTDIYKYNNSYVPTDFYSIISIYLENDILKVNVSSNISEYLLENYTENSKAELNSGYTYDLDISPNAIEYTYKLTNYDEFLKLYNKKDVTINELESEIKKVLVGQVELIYNNENGKSVPTYFQTSLIDSDYLTKYQSEDELIDIVEIAINSLERMKIKYGFTPSAKIIAVKDLDLEYYDINDFGYIIYEGEELTSVKNPLDIDILDDAENLLLDLIDDENSELSMDSYDIIERLRYYSDESKVRVNKTL